MGAKDSASTWMDVSNIGPTDRNAPEWPSNPVRTLGPFPIFRDGQGWENDRPAVSQNNPADKAMVTGNVNTQAITMFRTVRT